MHPSISVLGQQMRLIFTVICAASLFSAEPTQTAELGTAPKDIPTVSSSMRDRVNWLWTCSVNADRSRRYDLAEAFMAGVIAIDPDNGHALGSLACYVGKQGRLDDALAITDLALSKSRKDSIQLLGIKATWLGHLGKIAEASTIWDSLPQPSTANDIAMYWVCRAFYCARILKDEELVRGAMVKALSASPDNTHWKLFFKNDISFDAYSGQPWLIELTAP